MLKLNVEPIFKVLKTLKLQQVPEKQYFYFEKHKKKSDKWKI
jgi:hypothetical protein